MQMTRFLCVESEENLRAIVGSFIEMCRRRALKINSGKSKVMVLGVEKVLECVVCVNGISLEHVLEFKYLRCVLNESGADETEFSRKVVSEGRAAGGIRSLLNARSLQLECAMVLDESMLVSVLTCGSETIIWREKNKSRIRGVQVDILTGLLGIRRMDYVPNA